MNINLDIQNMTASIMQTIYQNLIQKPSTDDNNDHTVCCCSSKVKPVVKGTWI